ncbi:hypothetical protein R83H12_02968 [Fibrobacteria bacterium R8-3-H12]
MRNHFSKLALTAAIALAIALTFSCSSDKDDDNSHNTGGTSSPSVDDVSSSSGDENSYVNNDGYFKYYDSDDENQRCQNGVVQGKCGDVWYDKETHFCLASSSSTVQEMCGDNTIGNLLANTIFFGLAPLSKLPVRCQDGYFEQECGGVWFNYSNGTYTCINGNIKTIKEDYESRGLVSCTNSSSNDGSWYDPADANKRCNNGTVESKCGDIWYNSRMHTCKDGTVEVNVLSVYLVPDECGNGNYFAFNQLNPDSRCKDGIVEYKCGDVWYNTNTHTCKDNSVIARTRCGS